MKLQEIENKLNTLLTGTERKIVFWYDDDASYEKEIDQLHLASGNKLWKLTEGNWFQTKLLLEVNDTQSNYVVYAPFPKPDDRENLLADTFYYSEHFYSDKIMQLCGELGIPAECQDVVKKYQKFWNANQTLKFQNLQIGEYTSENIELGVMCVLAGLKVCNFEELIRKILLAGIEENAVLKKFRTYQILDFFWRKCEWQYGYKDSVPSLKKFLVTMLLTYTDMFADSQIPKEWKSFLSKKQNDVIIFVKNMMNHDDTRAFYDSIAEDIGRELNLDQRILEIPLENVVNCDSFRQFDENLIQWMLAKIEDRMLDEKIAGMTIPEICENRMKSCYHYARAFEEHYRMIFNGYKVIREVSLQTFQPTIQEAVRDYTEYTFQIDTWYRKFYYYLDRIGIQDETEKLRQLVENVYTNKYLADFSYKWNQSLSAEQYQTYSGSRQEDFFHDFVSPMMKEGGRDGRVIVIISDAFRYECAKELQRKLDLDEKCEVRMNHMLSVLPSETTLGMASLLPHQEIMVRDGLDVYVDDMKCGNNMSDRRRILQKRLPKGECLDFDAVKHASPQELREMTQDKNVIYIYQNQIDNRGESLKSENEVFNACQEAIEEIQSLIRRLTERISATRFLVTADHGFIYKRDRLGESEKISTDRSTVFYLNKRFMLSHDEILNDTLVSRMMTYLGKMNEFYVSTPRGAHIIKAPGGGQNYVHGGSSPQEMILPVIKVITSRGKTDTSKVNVELSYGSNRITNIVVYLEFIQMEAVTDTLKPRKLIAFFEDENKEKISYDVPIIADHTEQDPRFRMMKEKFILKSGNYSRGQDYYLVLADMEKPTEEHHRYKFEIDIAGII